MTARTASGKRGASKATAAKRARKVNMPGWIWLVTGLALGFFVATLMGLTPKAVDVQMAAESGEPSESAKPVNQPVFDFYTLLPESEISVTPESVVANPVKTPPLPLPEKKSSSSVTAATVSAIPKAKPKQYLLQVGSFRNVKDAERLRAQLLLDGLAPQIENVRVGNNEQWYRVQLGPFLEGESLTSARKMLAEKKMDSFLLLVKQ